ncbi:hypothetical protein NC653_011595 [Populus alba x Populus x berolinensis]|uniref:Uncharacterized protein n=1 Tax=Populus alba x Populus x berolinensis TaxID=444605 RepID=A0AAD6W752_9ROSI|nr:hypothetical protein NC653_011595 [Populus alba x Populus x berolinensis]
MFAGFSSSRRVPKTWLYKLIPIKAEGKE